MRRWTVVLLLVVLLSAFAAVAEAAPTVTLQAWAQYSASTTLVCFDAATSQDVVGADFYLDGAFAATGITYTGNHWYGNVKGNALSNGTHTASVVVRDANWNMAVASTSFSVQQPDRTPAVVQFTSPVVSTYPQQAFVTVSGACQVTANATDPESGVAKMKVTIIGLFGAVLTSKTVWTGTTGNATFTLDPKALGIQVGSNYPLTAWAWNGLGRTSATIINVRWTSL